VSPAAGPAGEGCGGPPGGGGGGVLARRGPGQRNESIQSQGGRRERRPTGGNRDVTKYETVYILEPSYDEVKAQEVADRVSGWLKDLGAEVAEVQKWGKRRLAYEIRKRRDGVYTMIVWTGGAGMVKELERRLRRGEDMMRALTTVHVPPEMWQGVPEAEAAAAGEEGDRD